MAGNIKSFLNFCLFTLIVASLTVPMYEATAYATSSICNFNGWWGNPRHSHDNMTIIQSGLTLSATASREGWKHAVGSLDPSYSTSNWNNKLTMSYPPYGRHTKNITNTGVANYGPNCTLLQVKWSDGSLWCQGTNKCGPPSPPPPPPPPSTANISDVYIVFSNHLDVGYTDNKNGSCAGSVVNRYFHDHFPLAIETANAFRNSTSKWRYTWMTQSWLVSMFRHCKESVINRFGRPGDPTDIICPNATQLEDFEAAVKRGDISWHAFPHNSEPEMYDPDLFLASLNITFREDAYYGHANRATLSQRDVPGLTRATIPLLSKYGIKGVSVGENGACAPVNVPPIFLWHDNVTNTEVVALFHPHGYGDLDVENEELDSFPEGLQAADDGTVLGSNRKPISSETGSSDCVNVASAGVAICYAWNSDNKGPHIHMKALAIFMQVQSMYPRAKVHSSDGFDDFITAVWPYRHTLPVVTQEIGDTWIQGASSDPLKVAQYRAISRLRNRCIKSGQCDMNDDDFQTFDRLLMKVGEHTWGWNGGDIRTKNYDNDELAHAIATDTQFSTAIWTWTEQRAFIQNAIAALNPNNPLKAQIKDELNEIIPKPFDSEGFITVDPSLIFPVGSKDNGASIGFDVNTGAINHLITGQGNEPWATSANLLGHLWYHGMDGKYFDDFTKAYNNGRATNFNKPGDTLPAISSNMTLTKLQKKDNGDSVSFLLGLTIESMQSHSSRGAPLIAEVLIETATTNSTLQMNYTIQWHNKTRCHAPETIWLSNIPSGTASKGWGIDKLGQWIDPLEANLGQGSQNGGGVYGKGDECNPEGTTCGVHLHAVNTGVKYSNSTRALMMCPIDSALLSIGSATPVPTVLHIWWSSALFAKLRTNTMCTI
eukprot:UC4_evm5s1059